MDGVSQHYLECFHVLGTQQSPVRIHQFCRTYSSLLYFPILTTNSYSISDLPSLWVSSQSVLGCQLSSYQDYTNTGHNLVNSRLIFLPYLTTIYDFVEFDQSDHALIVSTSRMSDNMPPIKAYTMRGVIAFTGWNETIYKERRRLLNS